MNRAPSLGLREPVRLPTPGRMCYANCMPTPVSNASLAEGLPRRRFSVADVLRMVEVGLIGEDERLEVLHGEIVPMSPKEPDFVVFSAAVPLAGLKGPDVLLAVEIADSSLDYDLRLKPRIYAGHGIRELWVIDVARRVTHVHRNAGERGYAAIEPVSAERRLEPLYAPPELALALDELRSR